MFCIKCGTQNNDGAKFCIKCGEVMATPGAAPVKKGVGENLFVSYFKTLFKFVTKPEKCLKEEKDLKDTKKALVFGGITAGIMMVVNLIIQMLVTPITKNYFTGKTQYVAETLKHLNYAKLILLDLIIFAAVIAGIAGIVCLVGLIFKKKVSYTRLLSISSFVMIPYAVGCLVLMPLFNTFSYFIGFLLSVCGLIYSIALLSNAIDTELKLEGNLRVYVKSIIFLSLFLVCYIIVYIKINTLLDSFRGLSSLGSYYKY